MVLVVIIVIAAGAAYWWFNRPEPDYQLEDSGLYSVVVNGKYGYIDKNGVLTIQPLYDTAGNFQEGLAAVSEQGKYGFIDSHGQMVIAPQFDYVRGFVQGFAAVKLCCGTGFNASDQWGFIGKDGKYVINPQFQQANDFHDGVASVEQNGKWGIVNASGKLIGNSEFNFVGNFSEGLAAASQGGRWGYIDKSGAFAIKPQFERALSFYDGLGQVRSGNKVGFINRSGKYVINPQFDNASLFRNGFAVVNIGSKSATIDKSGKFILNPGQITLGGELIGDDLVVAQNQDGLGYVDRSGVWVIPATHILQSASPMHGGIAKVRIAGEEAYINKEGAAIWGAYKGQSLVNISQSVEAEAAAAATVRTINTAQITYSTTYVENGYANSLARLGPVPPGGSPDSNHAGLVSAGIAAGEDHGYRFSLAPSGDGTITSGYSVTASPVSGVGRSFCTNQMAVIRIAKSGETCDPINSPAL